MLKTTLAISILAGSLFHAFVFAQTAHSSSTTGASGTTASSAAMGMSEGEVRKVDLENKKVTIKHGPIQNLDMPGMTMVFEFNDGSALNSIKTGDKVKFRAEKIDGKLIVTQMKSAR